MVLVALAAVAAAVAALLLLQPKPAPEVSGVSLAGAPLQTQDLRGRPYVVNFWATSCVTCVREMPDLIALHRAHAEQGVRTIAVAMAYDRPDHLAAFVADRGLPFDVIHDLDGRWAKAFGNITATPTTFLVSADGQLLKRYVGIPDFAEMDRIIRRELRPAPQRP